MSESKARKIVRVDSQETNNKNITNDLISLSIFTLITVIFIFLESIYILIIGLRKGIIKKEVLSRDSSLGFDLFIKMKS